MQNKKPSFTIEGYPPFSIEKIWGAEEISTCPHWQIQATATTEPELNLGFQLRNKKGVLYLSNNNTQRKITGIVSSLTFSKNEEGLKWTLNLKTKLYLLTAYRENEVFVNKNLKELCSLILKKVYKNNTYIYFDSDCKYPTLPFV